jgi:glycosyltransferase involved in cell wall biosynthesis
MQALEVSDALKRRGHTVWLACPAGSRLARAAADRHLAVLPLHVRGYFHPGAVRKLRRFCRAEAIDLVHSHLSKDLATLAPALAGLHTPLVLSKRVGSAIGKKDLLHRLTYARVDLVLAVSSVIHRNVLETTPMHPDRVQTLHDAIDAEKFSRKAFGAACAPDRNGGPVIGFVGRFSPGKGLEDLLEAAALLQKKGKRFRLVIAGEASHGEEEYALGISRRSTRLGLEGIVTFTGFRADVPELMAGFDVFAFPSHAESFGVALIEAMAMALPVVSTNCDGVLDIVVNGSTGLYVHPHNPGELAAALERLIDDPVLRKEFGEAGRRRVEEMFDRERQTDRLEEIYRSLISPRAA